MCLIRIVMDQISGEERQKKETKMVEQMGMLAFAYSRFNKIETGPESRENSMTERENGDQKLIKQNYDFLLKCN